MAATVPASRLIFRKNRWQCGFRQEKSQRIQREDNKKTQRRDAIGFRSYSAKKSFKQLRLNAGPKEVVLGQCGVLFSGLWQLTERFLSGRKRDRPEPMAGRLSFDKAVASRK
jgi:hypothetical protein